MALGCKYGTHRVIEPVGAMPQTAQRIDNDIRITSYNVCYTKLLRTDPNSKDWRDWPYIPGDAAMEAPDGYYRILGRIDDVINNNDIRITSYNVCYTKLLRYSYFIRLVGESLPRSRLSALGKSDLAAKTRTGQAVR